MIPTVIRQVLDPACAEISLGDLKTVRDFNYVADTVSAFLTIGLSEAVEMGRAYNAGSGVAVTIGEMVDQVLALTGCNKAVVQDQARFRPAASEVYTLLAESAAFAAATGWKPAETLGSGLEKTIDWWRARVAAGETRRSSDYLI